MSTFFYFAYGSNLLRQRLLLMNPTAVYRDIAQLKDYGLHFISPSEFPRWRGGAASIEDKPNSSIWGVVWELGEADSDSLDRQESCYDRLEVTVSSKEGKTYTCRTYKMKQGIYQPGVDNRPSPQYKDVIVRGARQNGLPSEYITELAKIEDNGYSGHVQVYEDVLKLLKNEVKQ
ncbi:hypothetical protein FSP39_024363 [Pinctada imbricata]|uniref:gamma-glutamylcyclotransferase n=1 Tax=Pinctada imbricata TaxID=66713 RepID=A0AA88XST2_PINIB|nr:hypothetical protein FSP39_024363 [Pinctada imbricata]